MLVFEICHIESWASLYHVLSETIHIRPEVPQLYLMKGVMPQQVATNRIHMKTMNFAFLMAVELFSISHCVHYLQLVQSNRGYHHPISCYFCRVVDGMNSENYYVLFVYSLMGLLQWKVKVCNPHLVGMLDLSYGH